MASPVIVPTPRINQVSGAIVNSAMRVHSLLGPGLLESAYDACLAHELRKRGFRVDTQVGLPVVYDGEKLDLGYRIDLIVENLDPTRERCWIAQRDEERVGSVFLVQKSKTISKLRLLLVEPSARGLGIGGRLVSECIRFAREAGYKKMMLWTQSELGAARAIYQKAGFELVERKRHRSWGRKDLVAETWELTL